MAKRNDGMTPEVHCAFCGKSSMEVGAMVTGLLSSFVGVICLASGSIGYLAGPLCAWKRIVMFVGTAMMLHPSPVTDILGIVIIVVMVFIQKKAFPKVTAEK